MNRTLVPLLVSALLGTLAGATLAGTIGNDSPPVPYLLSARGEWTAAHDAAITNAHGTVQFKHAASGLATAVSSDPNFAKLALRSGFFDRAGQDMEVQWVDPAQERVVETDLNEETVTPGDETFINLQWNVQAIEAPAAWAAGYTGRGVRVAILDGGIHSSHIDLDANLDVAHSTSFVPGFAYNQDTGTFWHGTHVAGIVAAEDNGIGTIGVAPEATIIGVKVLHNGSGSFGQVIQGILYASDPISEGGAGADIINMSLGALFARGGGNTGAGALVAAMAKAVNFATAHNVLVVSSAGNQAVDLDHSGSLIHVPSMSGSGIAIAATGPVGYAVGWPAGATNFRRPASYTNYGNSSTWVAAPGGDFVLPGDDLCSIPRVPAGSVVTNCWVFDLVLSTARGTTNGSYAFAAGTSMASPVVCGVAALVKQRFPGISVGDLKNVLAQAADDEGAVGHDPFYGRGFVNARRAVTEGGSIVAQGGASTAKSAPVAAPSRIELAVSPLPVRGHATFALTLPKAGTARVEIFDLAGRSVAMVFDGEVAAGRRTVSWNGGGLAAGAYFARLSSNGVSTDRKLLLLTP